MLSLRGRNDYVLFLASIDAFIIHLPGKLGKRTFVLLRSKEKH